MPSDKVARPLGTIALNIELARKFVAGSTREQFAQDAKTIYAVTRCLEIISEASRPIPAGIKERHPEIPWDRIAGSGNTYRHDYEDVLAGILWNTVINELGALDLAVRLQLRNLKEE